MLCRRPRGFDTSVAGARLASLAPLPAVEAMPPVPPTPFRFVEDLRAATETAKQQSRAVAAQAVEARKSRRITVPSWDEESRNCSVYRWSPWSSAPTLPCGGRLLEHFNGLVPMPQGRRRTPCRGSLESQFFLDLAAASTKKFPARRCRLRLVFFLPL